jgi:putative hydrolase of the HAD superfamily
MFELVLERTGTSPDEVLHIGDDPLRDIAPARGVGLRTAWINRYDKDWPEELDAADHVMTSLEEMPL